MTTPNPLDYRVVGSSGNIQVAQAGSGGLLSARFYENPTTSGHAEQEVGDDGVTAFRWSGVAFDNIGFPPDWGHSPYSGTFLFPTSGYYMMSMYLQAEPLSCSFWSSNLFQPGSISIVFEPTFVDDPDDDWWEQVSGGLTDPGIKLSLGGHVHKIDLAANPGAGFSVDVHSWQDGDFGIITRATMSIVKISEL